MPPSPSAPLLGLDTSTHTASVAVTDAAGNPLAHATLDTSGRGDDLLVLIDEVCRRANVTPRELGAVAVGAGPGSFTGLRIGLATGKGIAFAAGCPLWLVSSLAAMSAEVALAVRAGAAEAARGALIVPILDARRGEVFCGFYDADEAVTQRAAERVLAPDAVAEAVEQALCGQARPVAFCGDALAAFPLALASCQDRWLCLARTPSALGVIHLALRGTRHDELVAGRPAYLRPAEAEVKYPDGVPGALRHGGVIPE